MHSSEIRSLFLDYFKGKDHLVLPSYSLIPDNDPTLLLIGAGMAPLKSYFTGEKKPPHPRMATCQKCMRTPDIERVGITGRHATFFEMLGNFSFGDYFKERAIEWAWDFVINHLILPPEKLWITVYEEDDEAFAIWQNDIGIPADKIIRMGKDDNFWEIGPGPCGPCSEIHYDLGPGVGCGSSDCRVGCNCDRFLEIWNLVFTQFNRLPTGELVELERKNIDTGAGLERLAVVMQGASSLFEIDTVSPVLEYMAEETGVTDINNISLRILAEHIRGISFMIADGVLPSNEARGYVLRRILRRAVRHGRLLGMNNPFLFKAVPLIASMMKGAYPELKEREELIIQVTEIEEKKFHETLRQGLDILESYLPSYSVGYAGTTEIGRKVFPGDIAFRLYDTYGFPLDLTKEIIAEKGFIVDEEAFKHALELQKEKARGAIKTASGSNTEPKWENTKHLQTEFLGYEQVEGSGRVMALWKEGQLVNEAAEGAEIEFLVDRTPFYAEAGGQIGDAGTMEADNGTLADIADTYQNALGQVIHRGKVVRGRLSISGQAASVLLKVDYARRKAICRAHTATHLLHRALKDILGEHVNQAGSMVQSDRLRLDFTHFTVLSADELKRVEDKVNEDVLAELPVETKIASLEDARRMGAIALFGEKYAENVRVVSIGDYSRELCGGTHLAHTGQIGLIHFVREESVGSGLRRIEAVTGAGARYFLTESRSKITIAANMLKISPDMLLDKLANLLEENHCLQAEIIKIQREAAVKQLESLIEEVRVVDGVNVISQQVEAHNMDDLREMADRLRENMKQTVIVLGSVKDGKVMLVSALTHDLLNQGFHAGKLLSKVARKTGGGGGGRPDMAQAGGKNPAELSAALQLVDSLVMEQADLVRNSAN